MPHNKQISLVETVLTEKPSTILYHYTTCEGLLGIIRTRSLWASDIHYMNDATEFSYAIRCVRNSLEVAINNERGSWKDLHRSLLAQINLIENTRVFVCSLSERGDLLSQWRGYCPGGGGYSIGFQYEKLLEPMRRHGFRLIKCIYHPYEQEAVVRELLESAMMCLKESLPDDPDRSARIESTAQEFGRKLLLVGPAIKHTSFSEEKEWRLVAIQAEVDHPNVRLRDGKRVIIPYFDFSLVSNGVPLEIDQVNIGPNPHMEVAVRSLADAFTISGTKCHGVAPSRIPYRGW